MLLAHRLGEIRARDAIENRFGEFRGSGFLLRKGKISDAVVANDCGLKRSILYEMIAGGLFPAPIALTPSSRGWLEDEIDLWLDQRIAERDAGAVA